MQDIAAAIKSTLVDEYGNAKCAPSKVPQAVQALGKALCPLLESVLQGAAGSGAPRKDPDPRVQALGKALGPMVDATLQRHDGRWQQPSRLLDLDACSILLSCLSGHLHKCHHTPWMGSLLSSLQASGDGRIQTRRSCGSTPLRWLDRTHCLPLSHPTCSCPCSQHMPSANCGRALHAPHALCTVPKAR
jgi:hypothetical protein